MFTIQPVTTEEGFRRCQDILIEVWDLEKEGQRNIIPTRIFKLSYRYGGVVLATHDSEGKIIGFAWAFPALDEGNLFLFSDTLAVLPQYRDKGVGAQLKFAQRRWSLLHKMPMIRWTFDPLEARNSFLNITRLGGLSCEFERNMYGLGLTGPNKGLETDRFVIDWYLDSARVQECASTAQSATVPPDLPICLTLYDRKGEIIPGEVRLDYREPELLMPLPLNFQGLRKEHPDLSRKWRAASRSIFESYFGRGYAVVGYHIEHRGGERYGYYRLANNWRKWIDSSPNGPEAIKAKAGRPPDRNRIPAHTSF